MKRRYFGTLTDGYVGGSVELKSSGEIAARCALARSTDHPGFSRPKTLSHHFVPDASRPWPSTLNAASAQVGDRDIEGLADVETKERRRRHADNLRAWPPSVMVWPMAAALPPYSRCQNAWLSTARGAHPG